MTGFGTSFAIYICYSVTLYLFGSNAHVILFCRVWEYEAGSLSKDHLKIWILTHELNFIDRGFEGIEEMETVR